MHNLYFFVQFSGVVHLADAIHLHVTGTSTETGMLPRSLDVLFNSIQGRQWDNMALKPSMFCAVTKLSPEQEQLQHQIKESVLKLASDDVVSDSQISLTCALSLSLSLSLPPSLTPSRPPSLSLPPSIPPDLSLFGHSLSLTKHSLYLVWMIICYSRCWWNCRNWNLSFQRVALM